MNYPATLDGIEDVERDLESVNRSYLQVRGWRCTCEVGALWLWKREIGGKIAYLSESSALQYERMHSDEHRIGDDE